MTQNDATYRPMVVRTCDENWHAAILLFGSLGWIVQGTRCGGVAPTPIDQVPKDRIKIGAPTCLWCATGKARYGIVR